MTALSMAAPRVCWLLLLTLTTVVIITSAGPPANEDGVVVVAPGINTTKSSMRQRTGLGSPRGPYSRRTALLMGRSMRGLFNSPGNSTGNSTGNSAGNSTGNSAGNSAGNKDNDKERESAVVQLPEDMDMNKLDMNSMLMLSNVSTMEDYAAMLRLPMPSDNVTDGFSNSTLKESEVDAVSATCQPQEEIVFLHMPEEPVHPHLPKVAYFPRCVRLMRCKGCCTGEYITCQPTDFTDITLKVMRIEKSTSPDFVDTDSNELFKNVLPRRQHERSRPHASELKTSSSYSTVREVQHTKCECRCKVKEKDCIPALQDYDHSNCQCTCKNIDEQKKCVTPTHSWDQKTCQCSCVTPEKCSTGQYLDHTTCSCLNSY